MPTLGRRLLAFGDPSAPIPLLPLLAAGLVVILLNRPVHDTDIFWQLKLGELTLAHGPPAHEPFLAGRENEPLPNIAWLGQAVFAAVRLAGGWPLLRAFDAVVWLSAYVLIARQAGRAAGNDLPACAALWCAWFAAVPFASLRPQTFALAAFGLLVVLNRSRRPAWQMLPLMALVLVVGQNLHPATAVVGTVYLFASVCSEACVRIVRWDFHRDAFSLLLRLLLIPLAGLTTLATPQGADVFVTGAVNRDRCLHLGVTEWLPIWELDHPAGPMGRLYALPVMAGVALLLLVRGRRAQAADLLPLAVLTVMTCLTFRFIMFWGVTAIPVIVACLAPTGGATGPPHPARKWIGRIALLLAAAVPVITRPNHFAEYLPFAPLEALKAERVEGTIYTNMFAGGIITDLGHPQWKPSHDGRYYLFSVEQIDRHLAFRKGKVPVAEVEAEFRPVAVLLRPGDDDAAIELVKASGRWRLVLADNTAAVFVRK